MTDLLERGVWQRLGAAVKGLGRRKVPFAEVSTGGFAGAPLYGGGFGGGWGSRSPGATYDYATAAGELWENRVVAACVNAISQALSDAPPYLERREGAAWVKVETHPVIELLNAPNGYYGSPHLWSATAASECTAGQAFWRIEKSRAGLPAELWWEDARRFRALGDAEHFIKGYRFQTERGGWVELANDEVIHFRHALNPYNPREGRTPLSTGLRQVALDNGIASYSGSILRNSGVMSLLISTKDAGASAQITPGQIQDFVDKMKQRLFGDGAGGIAGLNLPIDVQKMSYSPDEMAVDKLTNYAEASICALLGVDPMVCGLGSGTMQKTYANMGEALNDFWERRIIPAKNRHSAELGAQLLPLYGLDTRDYRIAWDYSKVAALQENEDQKHARVRADYQAGLIDLYTAQTAIGLASDEARRGVYYGEEPGGDAFKGLPWREDLHPRDRRGRFTDGANQVVSARNGGVDRRAKEGAFMDYLNARIADGYGPHIDYLPAYEQGGVYNVNAGPRLGGPAEHEAHMAHAVKVKALCDKAFVDCEISHPQRAEYWSAMNDILTTMSPGALERFTNNLKSIVFYKTIDDVNLALEKIKGKKIVPAALGGHETKSGIMHIDGGDRGYTAQGIYAHEAGHSIDGPDHEISESSEWYLAWMDDLNIVGSTIDQAKKSPSEGFAEFARMAFSVHLPSEMKALYPACYGVWEKYGLFD